MTSGGEYVIALTSKCKLSSDTDIKLDVVGQLQREFDAGVELTETEELMNTLKACLRSPNQHLCIATLSAMTSLYVLLLEAKSSNTSHDLTIIRQYLNIFLPSSGIIEKLGDAKEKVREKAQQTFLTIGDIIVKTGGASSKGKDSRGLETPFQIFERYTREQGLASKNWRVREQTIDAVVKLRRIHSSFPLKPFLPGLVDSLESNDGTVRECAKQAIIEMFTAPNVSDTAKSELKKEMIKKNVRKSILDVILLRLSNSDIDKDIHRSDSVEEKNSRRDSLPSPVKSTPLSNLHSSRAIAVELERPSSQTSSHSEIAPVYVASSRDLESEFSKMLPAFEGKETEQNWLQRERSVLRVRGMLKGDVHVRFPEAFISGLKNGFLDGTLKSVASLRTTLASNTCSLYNDLVIALGQNLDFFAEILLTNLLRMAGMTKKVIATQSQSVVSSILKYASPPPRQIMSLLWITMQEKSPQSRAFVIEHLKIFVDYHGGHNKHAIDSATGTDSLEKFIRKGLADPNPGVREKSRGLYWSFEPLWKDKASLIFESLDINAKKQLQNACPSSTSVKPLTPPVKKSSVAATIAATRAKAKQIASAPSSLKQQALSTSHSQNENPSSPRNLSPPSTIKVLKFQTNRGSGAVSPSPLPNAQSLSPRNRKRNISISSSSSSPPPSPIKELYKRRISSPLTNQNPPSILDADISLEQSQFPVLQHLLHPQRQFANIDNDSLLTAVQIPLPLDDEDTYFVNVGDELTLSRKAALSDISSLSPSSTAPSRLGRLPTSVVEDALRARAAQAESAAEQLLELVEPDEELHSSPIPVSLLPHVAASSSTKLGSNRSSLPVTPVNKKSAIMRQVALFVDSPAPDRSPSIFDAVEERKHQTGWWLKRISILGQSKDQTVLDNNKRIKLLDEYITQLDKGLEEIQLLRELMVLCQYQEPAEPGSHPVDFGKVFKKSPTSETSVNIWDNGVRADALFNGLNNALQPDKDPVFLSYGLFILWELLPYLDGRDADVLALLLRLRYAQDFNVDEGTVTIRDAQVELMNERNYTLYGLSTMSICLKNFLSLPEPSFASRDVKLRAHAFGLITMAKFIVKLPADILEEELPKIKSNLIDAYLSSEAIVRQAATTAITAAQVILRDEAHLFALLGPLPDDKKNLLTYFFEKNNARSSTMRQDGVDKLAKEMDRLDQRTATPPRSKP
ncbi:hypothetical protein Clacol_001540 [Clathrus columnatus]|uniref:TOG domain-containing protein n=1 Tax=Clathrus columnatus TaxID=1419009 RepID=A0AAV5A228_9AGAM|nr:hypothetical protein Clacol_001540 [Clathrus columnatus]